MSEVILILAFFAFAAVVCIGVAALDRWHARRAWRRADQRANEFAKRWAKK